MLGQHSNPKLKLMGLDPTMYINYPTHFLTISQSGTQQTYIHNTYQLQKHIHSIKNKIKSVKWNKFLIKSQLES